MNYYREQVARVQGLPRDDTRYAIKIEGREGAAGSTKWLTITRDQLDRITDILAEGDDNDN